MVSGKVWPPSLGTWAWWGSTQLAALTKAAQAPRPPLWRSLAGVGRVCQDAWGCWLYRGGEMEASLLAQSPSALLASLVFIALTPAQLYGFTERWGAVLVPPVEQRRLAGFQHFLQSLQPMVTKGESGGWGQGHRPWAEMFLPHMWTGLPQRTTLAHLQSGLLPLSVVPDSSPPALCSSHSPCGGERGHGTSACFPADAHRRLPCSSHHCQPGRQGHPEPPRYLRRSPSAAGRPEHERSLLPARHLPGSDKESGW